MGSKLLIIFVKNPVAGKVKTRLAASIGDLNALQIYKILLSHTREVAAGVQAVRQVWYSSKIDRRDSWNEDLFKKKLQRGDNLGQRMENAFRQGFDDGYEKIVIIGSDCAELTSHHIEQAFDFLDTHDAVIGPSQDGGYYLLGLREFQAEVFGDVTWSSSSVFSRTVHILTQHSISYKTLGTLNDIDTIDDLRKSSLIIQAQDQEHMASGNT